MATTLFKDTTYSVYGLIEDIKHGEVALPDIQRPFVWQASKVRDLLDSMYKGFPVGYLLFWETGADVGAHQIGTGEKQKAPRLLIVDGQQRLTSLYAVITGSDIVREDYSQGRIRIAFRPSDATFAVTDAAIEKDPEYVPDVSRLWSGEYKKTVKAFLQGIADKRELTEDERYELEESIDRLRDLRDYPFKAVELAASVDEEQVAEVFVRINSEGVTLNQADFILTLMSVFWEKGRRQLEDFARAAKTPSVGGASPFNWYLQPSPPQMLRVSVALAFRRAALKHVYTLLRGKDPETGKADPAKREERFGVLAKAQDHALNLVHWHEYLQCLERAGYRGAKMISSDNALLFSYALWLIGRVNYNVPLDKLRELIARWFFMAHLTGRYTGSFESRFEQDMARLSNLTPGDSKAFIAQLSTITEDTLTADFWTITLPNELATSAAKSPALLAYIAALNILDADALLSTGKVRSRLDPAITLKKGIERHHIFPRAYLKSALKITDTKEINQIANMALVEWADNIAISDDAPTVYWPQQLAARQLPAERLVSQMYWHALPQDWEHLNFRDFLRQRRSLMGQVVKDAYAKLCEHEYHPSYPQPGTAVEETHSKTSYSVTLYDLIEADLLPAGTTLISTQLENEVLATVLPDGKIAYDGEVYGTPSSAGSAASGWASANGWTFWAADTADGRFTLSALREQYLSRST